MTTTAPELLRQASELEARARALRTRWAASELMGQLEDLLAREPRARFVDVGTRYRGSDQVPSLVVTRWWRDDLAELERRAGTDGCGSDQPCADGTVLDTELAGHPVEPEIILPGTEVDDLTELLDAVTPSFDTDLVDTALLRELVAAHTTTEETTA